MSRGGTPYGPKFVSAEQAADLIQDGMSLAIGGSGGGLVEPNMLLAAVGDRYRETQGPKDLTLIHTTGIGDRAGAGMDHFAQAGLVKRVIAGNWGMAPAMSTMAVNGDFEAYNFPQGVMSQLYREIAAGRPGLLTHVGLGTFCDPRVEAGRLNDRSPETYVEVVELAGREWLFYHSFGIDICFVRGTTADMHGNISMEEEAAHLEMLAMAQATHNSGGIVVAQVKYLADANALDARTVEIPGILVDYVVHHPEQMQVITHAYNPGFSGGVRVALSTLPPFDLDQRKVVARRAIHEVRPGDIVNLGVGIADGIAAVAAEEGVDKEFTLTVEQGLVGGIPARGVIFGASTNPDAIMDQPAQFDFYDGGGLDVTFLGFAEIDGEGNVNVSKFGGRVVGTGGFVNISQNASTVVFCGTFTAGGLKATPKDGVLEIETEGRNRKFVAEVEQITFSGKESVRRGQRVLYVTERAVFTLEESGLRLLEVAPGIDIERDVLDLLPFEVASDGATIMDRALFKESTLGIAKSDTFTRPIGNS